MQSVDSQVIHPTSSIPGPLAAASASSPMKKSKSSVPLFMFRCPPAPAPPVNLDGLLATAGRPEPEPPLPVVGPFVAIAVGKTKEGESLPANPTWHLGQPGLDEFKHSVGRTELRETGPARE